MSEKHVPTLETKKLGISFGGLKAVSDFNITIDKGELVGLIGPNGAGKTTVFNLLTGVYKPTEGTVLLDGVPLNGKKTHQFVAAGIARTFQNIRLFKDMTVIENVKSAFTKDIGYGMLDAALRTPKFWRLEREATDKAMDLLDICGLADKADKLASSLPYGQQRKLEIDVYKRQRGGSAPAPAGRRTAWAEAWRRAVCRRPSPGVCSCRRSRRRPRSR